MFSQVQHLQCVSCERDNIIMKNTTTAFKGRSITMNMDGSWMSSPPGAENARMIVTTRYHCIECGADFYIEQKFSEHTSTVKMTLSEESE